MNKILKESEAKQEKQANQAGQSYASIASPQILYYLKSISGGSEKRPRHPGDLFGEPPLKFWGAPKKIFYTT